MLAAAALAAVLLSASAPAQGADVAVLGGISVTAAGDSVDRLHGFAADHSVYHAGFGAGVSQARLAWTAADGAVAAVSVLDADGDVLEDAGGGEDGHQVDLEEGGLNEGTAPPASVAGYDTDAKSDAVSGDSTGELELKEQVLYVNEGSHDPSQDSYGVRLSAKPTGEVSVTLSVVDGADSDLVLVAGAVSVTVSGSGSVLALTFSTADWDTFQSVTVHASHDDDLANEIRTLAHTASGGGYAVSANVVVNVYDDDTGDLEFDGVPVAVVEGESAVYGVKLSVPPFGKVTVSVFSISNNGLVLAAGSVSVSSSNRDTELVLTFSTADWDTFQSVTVHAGGTVRNEVLQHTASGPVYRVSRNVDVAVVDSSRLVFSDVALSVDEGSHAKYGVKLSEKPTGNVAVSVPGGARSDLVLVADSVSVTVSDSGTVLTLTFSSSDWNTYKSRSLRDSWMWTRGASTRRPSTRCATPGSPRVAALVRCASVRTCPSPGLRWPASCIERSALRTLRSLRVSSMWIRGVPTRRPSTPCTTVMSPKAAAATRCASARTSISHGLRWPASCNAP